MLASAAAPSIARAPGRRFSALAIVASSRLSATIQAKSSAASTALAAAQSVWVMARGERDGEDGKDDRREAGQTGGQLPFHDVSIARRA